MELRLGFYMAHLRISICAMLNCHLYILQLYALALYTTLIPKLLHQGIGDRDYDEKQQL